MSKITKILLFWLVVFFICAPVAARTLKSVQVRSIVDGDTIIIASGPDVIKVRLWGIDTPEHRQPYSKAAAKITRKLLKYAIVDLVVKDYDDYGRLVAVVNMKNGESVNELLIKKGYAWVHIYYCKEPVCETWKTYEKEARTKQLGLWQDAEPVAPWVWKRQNPYRKKK